MQVIRRQASIYLKKRIARTIVVFLSTVAAPPATFALPTLTVQKFETHLQKRLKLISDANRGQLHDCIDESQSAAAVPLKIRNDTFNYFNPRENFQHYIGEFSGWPLVISFAATDLAATKRTVVVPFRGDTFGYHKSFLTPPIIEYVATDPEKLLVFPGEFIYVKKPVATTEATAISPVMSLCHNRSYWFGRVGPEWPLVNEHAWPLLHDLFPFEVNFEFIAYSNGTVSRNAFLRREATHELEPYRTAGLDPKQYLNYYIEYHSAPPAASRQISKLIDIEGNFRISDDLWDLIAFIRDEIMPDPLRSYYSIVRVDKPDAFPVNVIMIRALELEATETREGVLRYTNKRGNVVMEVLGRNGSSPYGSAGNNLLRLTPVRRLDGKVRRQNVSHFGIIDFALKPRAQ